MNILNSFPVRHRDFGLFWAGIFLVNIAVQIEAVTIGWQIYGIGRQSMSIGESAFLVGIVGVALEPTPQVSHIFAIAAVFGAARAFLSPASSATVPMLVPKSEMPQAISLKSLAWQTAVIIGPWIGGLLCAI